MAVLACILIAVILLGIGGILIACTRAGRRVRQGAATPNEPVQPPAATRSDLQGPHRPARSPEPQRAMKIAPSLSAEVRDDSPVRRELADASSVDRREVEQRINGRLEELEQLVDADEEDLGEIERLIERTSRRERRRTQRRPKNRRDESDEFDAA